MSLRYLGVRLLGIVWVTVAATATAWLIVHVLRPNLFPDESGPLLVRLYDYLVAAFLHSDFGQSRAVGGGDVFDMIVKGLPADVALLAGGLLFGLAGGVVGGVISARRPRSAVARALDGLAMLAFCAPVYVVGLGLLLLLGDKIALLHVGLEIPTYYVEFREDPLGWFGAMLTPWIVLGLPLAGMCLRVMKSSVVEVAHEDFIRAAYGKGLSERQVLRRHALPVALGPTAVLAGTAMPFLLTNLVLVEQVYSVPGVFKDFTASIGTANYPLIFGMTAVGALLIATANLVFDIFLLWLDPRVRSAS